MENAEVGNAPGTVYVEGWIRLPPECAATRLLGLKDRNEKRGIDNCMYNGSMTPRKKIKVALYVTKVILYLKV